MRIKGELMQTLLQDLRYGARMLVKKPGFTLIAVITLALGIGANTAIFSIVNTVLLRPLPYPESDQLVLVWGRLPGHGLDKLGASPPEFADYRAQNQVFSAVACYASLGLNLTGGGEPERITATYVSASLFPVLGVQPVAGRIFWPEEDQPGHNQVVMLSHGLWQRRFAGQTRVIGQTITLNGRSHTVIGVMPASLQFLHPETEVWKPMGFTAEDLSENERGSHYLSVIARLRPGVTERQAQADLAAIARRMQQQHPTVYQENSGWGATIIGLHAELVGDVQLALWVLLGAVGCVLLVACANVANLLLQRAVTRQREMAIRSALGAGRWRIMQQLLAESPLLALVGGGLGLLLAVWSQDWLLSLSPADLPRLAEIGIDGRVLGFTFAVSLLTGWLFGLAPGWQSSRLSLNEALKEGSGKSAASGSRHRLRGALVAGEIAVTLVLLIGAGLMLKSLYRLQQVEPGFDPSNVLTMRLALQQARYSEPRRQRAFFEQLLARIASLPGVQAAGAVNYLPLSGTGNRRNFSLEGQPEPKLNLEFRMISPDYFRALGIRLRAGRLFSERDREDAPRVAIINETFARLFFSNEDPLGKRIRLGNEQGPFPWLTIVGVVKDVKHGGLDLETSPEMYVPYLQPLLPDWNVPPMFLAVRAGSEASNLTAAVRSAVQDLDRDQPLYSLATMEQLLARSMAPRRFNMLLLAAFASLALLLSVIGIYGVISYSVTQRTHEIGVRIALGARAGDVLRLVVGQGMWLAVIGVGMGLVAALALTRLMANLLYRVSTTDPVTFAVIALLLISIALLACYLPARRAMRVDPLVALRYE
jgi:putative ABC transport system permease protein